MKPRAHKRAKLPFGETWNLPQKLKPRDVRANSLHVVLKLFRIDQKQKKSKTNLQQMFLFFFAMRAVRPWILRTAAIGETHKNKEHTTLGTIFNSSMLLTKFNDAYNELLSTPRVHSNTVL